MNPCIGSQIPVLGHDLFKWEINNTISLDSIRSILLLLTHPPQNMPFTCTTELDYVQQSIVLRFDLSLHYKLPSGIGQTILPCPLYLLPGTWPASTLFCLPSPRGSYWKKIPSHRSAIWRIFDQTIASPCLLFCIYPQCTIPLEYAIIVPIICQ